jgi:hypothetical protein
MYGKFSKILRMETTVNDISFFKHCREAVRRDGTKSNETARLKKGIYSLTLPAENLKAANRRYIEFISGFENKQAGRKKLEKISESKVENNRNCKGFNFFDKTDLVVLPAILSGEFNICGFRNRQLKQMLRRYQ